MNQKSDAPCPGCGETGFHTQYSGSEGKRMATTGECFTCAFWEIRCEAGESLVIDHHVYGVGPEPKPGENPAKEADPQYPPLGAKELP